MPPSKVGYYQIQRLLGEGGMGAVYEGVHRMTGRRVGIKMLRSEFAERPDLQARFFNEARTTSFLDHPGIVRVFDVGRADDGSAYMVMELCRGPTLGEAFKQDPRTPVRLALIGAVAEALAYAHAQGVIHRDLKPENIIITAGPHGALPKVLDFGIAKVMEGAVAANSPWAVKTRTGSAIGTPLYMSPEQCRGVGGITQASDVYSLGIMIYECVRGRVPFDGGVGEVIVQHLTTPAPRLGDDTLIDVLPELDPLVAAMLEKSAAARPSMAEVAAVLTHYAPLRRSFLVAPDPAPAVVAPLTPTYPSGDDLVVHTSPDANSSPISVEEPVRQRGPSMRISYVPLVVGVLVAVSALSYAIYRRATGPLSASVLGSPTAPPPRPVTAPPLKATPLPWTVESSPETVDVFLPDGTMVGRTPYLADALLARGERALYLRKAGFRDEIVRYDGHEKSTVQMHPRTVQRPRPVNSKQGDDFEIHPLH